jgi:hypothetical protein
VEVWSRSTVFTNYISGVRWKGMKQKGRRAVEGVQLSFNNSIEYRQLADNYPILPWTIT